MPSQRNRPADVAAHLAKFFRKAGVRYILGVPGTETIDLIEASRKEGLDFVLTHHEATAAFAAAMIGHLTRVPGVCLVAGGPGTANTSSGIFGASLDKMPLCVVIGDHVRDPALPTHQRLPFEHVAPGVVRGTYQADAATIAQRMPSVFGLATSPVPGPVLVSVSTTDAGQLVADETPHYASETKAEAVDVSSLAGALAGAQRIFIAIGLGVTWTDTAALLERLATHLGAPVADTPQSKGWFPNDHPLYAGTVATRRNAHIKALADRADVVLAIGLDSVELLSEWDLKSPVVALSSVGAGEPAIPATAALNAPLVSAIGSLLDILPARSGQWAADELESVRADLRAGLWPPGASAEGTLFPQQVVDVLQRESPDDCVLSTDIGSHKLLLTQQWIARRQNRFLNSSGLASMGSGFAFALAAKLSMPQAPVASVIGDGGLLMYAGEVATLARLSGPFVVVVMNDGALSSIRIKQLRRSYHPTGTVLPGPKVRLADMAMSLGVDAVRVDTVPSLSIALRRGFTSATPMLVEAVVDPAGYEFAQ